HPQDARVGGASDEGLQAFLRFSRANDEAVGRMLNPPPAGRAGAARVGRGQNLAALVAAYCSPESSFHKSERLIPLMERAAQAFVDAQNPDGTLDAGNLASPPDTG